MKHRFRITYIDNSHEIVSFSTITDCMDAYKNINTIKCIDIIKPDKKQSKLNYSELSNIFNI